jgi:hypothetical protein
MTEATPAPVNPTLIPKWMHGWTAFVKAHERLVITGVIALVLIHYGDKAYNAFELHEKGKQSADNQQIAQLHNDNLTLAQQLAKMQADYSAKLAAMDAKIAASKQAEQDQQRKDAALPLPDLAVRWAQILALGPGNITPQPNGTLNVTVDAAHTTVNELDKVGPLTEQLLDTQTKLDSCVALNTEKDKAITGKEAELAAEKKARADDATVAKEKQRHAWWSGFKWGAITGFVGGVVALHKL